MENTTLIPEELWTKKGTATFYKCSERQVELLSAAGKIPKPIYLGSASPRWRKSDVMAHLDAQQNGGAE